MAQTALKKTADQNRDSYPEAASSLNKNSYIYMDDICDWVKTVDKARKLTNDLDQVLGSVVQSWVSTNSGLKFNPMFQFLYFYISVYFKTSQTKTTIDQDKIC